MTEEATQARKVGGPRFKAEGNTTDRRGSQPGQSGQPPFIPTAEQRQDVRSWAKAGLTQEDIANLLDVNESTVKRHFGREWKVARIQLKVAIGSRLATKALAGDNGCMFFWLRTQGRWSMRYDPNELPGEVERFIDVGEHLDQMTDEQLDLLEPILEQLLAEGGAGIDFRDQIGPAPAAGTESEAQG